MPKIKYSHIVRKLIQKPVFTSHDMVSHGIPQSYVKRLASHLISQKRIRRIEKGKYTQSRNPMIIAPFLTFPSYLSMFTALSLRNAILQVPQEIQVVSPRRRKNTTIKFENATIRFFCPKPSMFFGYSHIDYEKFKIPVADIEKAIIDLAYFGYEPIGEISAEIDINKVKEYFNLVNKKAVEKRALRWVDVSSQ